MATLEGNTIASTYPLLLKIDSSGIDGTLRAVEDGDGTDSALSIATDSVLVKGDGVKLYFYDADGSEHISADASGNLTIGAGVDLNLTATTDINIPVNVGLRFGDGGENIETDNTNLTITSGGAILLSATGNVGIGVTPQAWDTTRDVLQIGTAGFLASRNNANVTYLGNNWYRNASGTDTYIGNDEAIALELHNSGNFYLKTAPASTGAITWTTPLTVSNNGKVGIGATSPAGALHIAGTGVGANMYVDAHTDGGDGPNLIFRKSNNTTIGGFTKVDSGDILGQIYFQGADTDSWETGGAIRAVSTEDWSASARGTKLEFYTVDNTTTTADLNMVIDHNGNVGIGTTSPSSNLHVENVASAAVMQLKTTATNSNMALRMDNDAQSWDIQIRGGDADAFQIRNASTDSPKLVVLPAGNVGIGTASPDTLLVIGGDSGTGRILPSTDNVGYIGESSHRWQAIYAVNGSIQTSDERQKTEITDTSLGLGFIKQLRPVSYKWKVGGYDVGDGVEIELEPEEVDSEGNVIKTAVRGLPKKEEIAGKRNHYGLIAQEVKEVLGDTDFGGWVIDDLDDSESTQSLRYDQFISPLIKAVQELSAEVEALKNG